MMEKVSPGQLRIWGNHAGWQDQGKVFLVLSSLQDHYYCEILQENKKVKVKTLFIETFSVSIHD